MYTRRKASCHSLKNVILSFPCMISMPYAMDIICGIPGGRQLAMGSYSYDPLIRDFLMISHLAMYSGVSKGAVGDRPLERSPVGAERVGGGGVARWPAGVGVPRWPPAGAAAAAPPPRPC